MLVQILGMVLSGIISLVIAHLYYKKASKDLKIETSNLKDLNNELKVFVAELRELDESIISDTDIIRKIITYGTPNDPDYPYK